MTGGAPWLRSGASGRASWTIRSAKATSWWSIGRLPGTHRGEFLGVPPTNKLVAFSGITINQIVDGKILESTVIWDGLGLMKPFGIEMPVQYEMLVAGDGNIDPLDASIH
jgi:SnoaL-like polyketide cyclase